MAQLEEKKVRSRWASWAESRCVNRGSQGRSQHQLKRTSISHDLHRTSRSLSCQFSNQGFIVNHWSCAFSFQAVIP
jgi:hypothetical protein